MYYLGYNKNIYAKKNAKDINIIKNNKKNNNQINKSKRDIYESPSDKSMKKNNINYSTDQISNLSTNKKITPFNYNNISNFSKQITNKKKEEEEDEDEIQNWDSAFGRLFRGGSKR